MIFMLFIAQKSKHTKKSFSFYLIFTKLLLK